MRVVLGDIVLALGQLITDLEGLAHAEGDLPEYRDGWRRRALGHAGDWLLQRAVRRGDRRLRVLARRESALLHAFERAIGCVSAEQQCVLQRQLPRLYGIQLDLDTLSGTASH